jgi:hypothetical protein
MTRRSFANKDLPPLLSCFEASKSGWFLQINDIGSNSGFPGYFDWNDHFADDDGALILPETSFPEISRLNGFKAFDKATGASAFISFERSAVWEEHVLVYRISVLEMFKSGSDRPAGINMELSAVLAAVCLQIKTDWVSITENLKSGVSDWTLRTDIELCNGTAELADALYEISNDAACRFYDDYPAAANFTGFEEPTVINKDA